MAFLRKHSLSFIVLGILTLWFVLYLFSDPNTHMGAFYGNAIADWSGSAAVVILTKFLYERGSAESKRPPRKRTKWQTFLEAHSLTIVLIATGTVWALLFARSDPQSRWGQVVGNVTSEWLQMIGLVILTKRFTELGSKESKG